MEKGIIFGLHRTKDKRIVYAIVTEWPGTTLALTSVRPKEGSQIFMLGSNTPLKWRGDGLAGTLLELPENMQQPGNRPTEFAWSFKIETDG